MAFSPGPNDLLAWTEDRGRVGVADLRTRFDSRQILHLDKEDDFELLAVTDRGTIDPRLLEQRVETLLSNSSSMMDSESRHHRQAEGQPALAGLHRPLIAEETAVLEAIQDYRRRQDQYNAPTNRTGADSGSSTNGNSNGNGGSSGSNGNGRGGSGNGSGSGSGAGARQPWLLGTTRDPARAREHPITSRTVIDMLDNLRDQRDRARESQERLRAREDNTAERRRYAASPFSGVSSTLRTAGSGTSGRGALVARLIANATIAPSSGGWENVEALYDPLPRDNQPSATVLSRIC
jgi:hypothetical protein